MRLCRYAACAALLSCSSAHAESGVTLYGIVDEFFQYVNTGNHYTAAIGSSSEWASRFGLKGSEDITGCGCSSRSPSNSHDTRRNSEGSGLDWCGQRLKVHVQNSSDDL